MLLLDAGHNFPARVLLSGRALHIPDWSKVDLPAHQREVQADLKVNSALMLPLVRDGECIGVLGVGRAETQAFAPREIALLESFADQAVIAIENVRLFNETKEALERQTASNDILKVMAASPGDVQPVFDAIVADAQRLTGATTCHVHRVDGEWLQLAAFSASDEASAAALKRMFPLRIADFAAAAQLRAGQPQLVADAETDERFNATIRAAMRARGVRSSAIVPLMRGGEWIGGISVNRAEAGVLDTRKLDLLRGFADQAAIAIQNARLFNETKEALERETASAEVLRVVGGSMADAQPVFESICASMSRLLPGADLAIGSLGDDGLIHWRAGLGESLDAMRQLFPRPAPASARLLTGKATFLPDLLHGEGVPESLREGVRKLGRNTSMLSAAMTLGDQVYGTIAAFHFDMRPFSDDDARLIKSFADQAVIAIQNARLFNETQEALEQQTATADILRVISESPNDIQPVFHAIVGTAFRLFKDATAILLMREGDHFRVMSVARPGQPISGPSAELTPLDAQANFPSQVMLGKKALQLPDWLAIELTPHQQQVQAAEGFRSSLMLPIMQGDECIGAFGIARKEPGEFSAKQIALLRAFVDQAVIAIQNVRLFRETQEALERQTATAEVLQVISSSVADTQPVFEKILDSCQRLFSGAGLGITLVGDDGQVHLNAHRGLSPEDAEDVGRFFPRAIDESIQGYAIRKRRVLHYPDIMGVPRVPEVLREIVARKGNASALIAPMLWQDRGVGAIHVYRRPQAPFSDKEIDLLKTFADQAAIAIQNAQLFKETQEALSRQTATAEILQAISGLKDDLAPVVSTIIDCCQRLRPDLDVIQIERISDETVHLIELRTGPAVPPRRRKVWQNLIRGLFPFPEQALRTSPARVPAGRSIPNVRDDPDVPERCAVWRSASA